MFFGTFPVILIIETCLNRLHYENLRAVIPDPDYNIRIQLQEIDHDVSQSVRL